MKKIITALSAVFFLFLFCGQFVNAAEHRLGGGVNYWRSIDDLKGDDFKFDNSGFGFIGSYQYWGGLLGVEVDVELLPDMFDETVVAPQAYLLLGRAIYAGIGIGTTYIDGEFADEPFYALRGGFCLELLPRLYADLYATYRFNDGVDVKDAVDDIDTDTLFLGAMARFSL